MNDTAAPSQVARRLAEKATEQLSARAKSRSAPHMSAEATMELAQTFALVAIAEALEARR